MKIGLPKALYYYYMGNRWINFFNNLNIEVITYDTNKEILDKGVSVANDEMCLSLKIFLGHVSKLSTECDYIFIPHINNFGCKDQMCCNFLSLNDLVKTLFDVKILSYEINHVEGKNEKMGFYKIGKELGFNKKQIKQAYKMSINKEKEIVNNKIIKNTAKLNTNNKKILLVSHSYNMYDNYISGEIIKYLEKSNCEIIYCDSFKSKVTSELSKFISRDLYFKYSKENIGAIVLSNEKIDGIIFLSTFPCGLDSLVNELAMRKIGKPYLNLVIDDLDSNTGIETRLESFIDIIEQN